MADVNTVPDPTVGIMPEVYIGSYRLLRPLGNGGMSSVFHAVHTESGLEVALKVLPRALAQKTTLLQRFLREARSAEALQHPNIVEIYDRGEDQGRHYLALEFVDGGDLHERVRGEGLLKGVEAIRLVRATAEGLGYAASRGVIHRDVKPANILIDRQGKVKITDLGLALQLDDEDERVTRDGTTVGTVDYMSPEQARDSRATSIRSDIYSLGCTLYFLLTGAAPFAGGDLPTKLRRHALEAPPDIRRVRPDLSLALSRLIQKMLAKSPGARFPDYAHLMEALDALPVSDLDPDGDPQLVPLDDEEASPDSSTTKRVGTVDSSTARTEAVGLVGLQAPAEPRTGSSMTCPSPAGSRYGPTPAAGSPVSRPGPAKPPVPPAHAYTDAAPLLREILDEEEAPHLPSTTLGLRRGSEPSVQDYIIRGIVVGLAIAVVGLATTQVARLVSRTSTSPAPKKTDTAPATPIDTPVESSEPLPMPEPKPEPRPDDSLFIPESPETPPR